MITLNGNVFVEAAWYPTVSCVVTPEGLVAIDGPLKPSLAVKWRDRIGSQGPLRYLINTEHHRDHIAANHFLSGIVIANEGTKADFLETVGSDEQARRELGEIDPEGAPLLAAYRLRPPAITYRDRLTLYLGGNTFRLIHSPGHTRGQTIVHAEEARVVFTGDNLVHGTPPFFHGASVRGWFRSLDMLESIDADWFVPGHGEPCKADWIPRLRAQMRDVVEEVRREKEKGLGREEVQDRVRYIDRPGFFYPEAFRERYRDLERVGVGNIYDQLEEHPAE